MSSESLDKPVYTISPVEDLEARYSHILDSSSPSVQALERIGQNLLKHSTSPQLNVNYYIIPTDEIDAFAISGESFGHRVYVSIGIINACESNDVLAGLLAHELTHIIHGDTMSDDFIFTKLRMFEMRADYNPLEMLNAAGYNPTAYKKLMQKLADRNPGGSISHGNTHGRADNSSKVIENINYTNSSNPESPKPLELTNEVLTQAIQPDRFTLILDSYNSSKSYDEELRKLSVISSAHFYEHVFKKFVGKKDVSDLLEMIELNIAQLIEHENPDFHIPKGWEVWCAKVFTDERALMKMHHSDAHDDGTVLRYCERLRRIPQEMGDISAFIRALTNVREKIGKLYNLRDITDDDFLATYFHLNLYDSNNGEGNWYLGLFPDNLPTYKKLCLLLREVHKVFPDYEQIINWIRDVDHLIASTGKKYILKELKHYDDDDDKKEFLKSLIQELEDERDQAYKDIGIDPDSYSRDMSHHFSSSKDIGPLLAQTEIGLMPDIIQAFEEADLRVFADYLGDHYSIGALLNLTREQRLYLLNNMDLLKDIWNEDIDEIMSNVNDIFEKDLRIVENSKYFSGNDFIEWLNYFSAAAFLINSDEFSYEERINMLLKQMDDAKVQEMININPAIMYVYFIRVLAKSHMLFSYDFFELKFVKDLKAKVLESIPEMNFFEAVKFYDLYIWSIKELIVVSTGRLLNQNILQEIDQQLSYFRLAIEDVIKKYNGCDYMEMYELFSQRIYFMTNKQKKFISKALAMYIEKLPFDEGYAFLQQIEGNFIDVNAEALYLLVNHKLQTTRQYDLIAKQVDQYLSEGTTSADNIIAGDSLMLALVHNLTPDKLFDIATATKKNDNALKNELFYLWVLQTQVYKIFGNIDPSEAAYESFNDFVSSFYLSIPHAAKDNFLKKVLLGSKGLLVTPEGRKKVLEFTSTLISEDDSEEQQIKTILLEALASSFEILPPHESYHLIAPLILPHLFIPPTTNNNYIPNDKIIERVWDDLDDNSKFNKSDFISDLKSFTAFTRQHMPSALDSVSKVFEEKLNEILNIEDTNIEPVKEKVSSIDALLGIAQILGPMGIKGLQISDQFFQMPEQYREVFSDAYENNGRARIMVIKNIADECKSPYAPDILREFWENVAEFGSVIGGGSLMSVIAVTMKDGSKKAVKILTPNAEYFIKMQSKQYAAVLENMPSYKDSKLLQMLRNVLVPQIKHWMQLDIAKSDDPEWDAEFLRQNPEIGLPVTMYTNISEIRIEELIEGTTLTPILEKNPQSARPYLAQLTANLFQALANGGLIHSDLTPGNIIVNIAGKLVLIDKAYWINLPKGLSQSLFNMISGGISLKNVQVVIENLMVYDDNKNKSTPNLDTQITAIINTYTGNVPEIARHLFTLLRENGIYIPLDMDLLLKNLSSLMRMYQRADALN